MTLLIKNVRILGGAKSWPELVDVFVNGEKISAIGNFPTKPADVVIDGQEAYLSPGFIDVNTDSDHYLTLFANPDQEDFLKQGVTTIFGGLCGSSLAPLLYGSLESFQKWGDVNQVNVNWHTMSELLQVIDKQPFAVNFGTLVGHSTIRRALVGEALRDLTKNELTVFSDTLRKALAEGGYGLSTGLGYVHARKVAYPELKNLALIAKEAGTVYATHLRNTGKGIQESVAEVIKLAKETGVKVLINHFVPIRGAEKDYEEALGMIEALPADVDLRFDIYPSSSSLLALYTFLPEWAQTGGVDVMFSTVRDEWLQGRIKKDMPEINEDDFIIAQAPGNDFLVGKSLREAREMYELKDPREALIKLMDTMKMKGGVLYKNLNSDLAEKAMRSKRSLIASNAPSFKESGTRRQLKSERTISTFPKFLRLAEDRKLMPVADAVKKLTLEPARLLGLPGRGEIKEGNIADLVCFKGNEVKFTVVNGTVAQKNGEFSGKFPGKALRHSVS